MKASDLASKIADFVCQFSYGLYTHANHSHIEAYVNLHLAYGTIMVIQDKGQIVAVCRWNQPSASHAHILDFIVHPNYRNKFISREMFKKAKAAMPGLKTISFERIKYSMRERVYPVSKWIKEKSWAEEVSLK